MPRSFVCSSVDILPLIYSLALGNESWRCYPTDMINYLNGRESIMDAMMGGTQLTAQRRLSTFPLTNSQGCYLWQQLQPYVLHTMDEYWNLSLLQSSVGSQPADHAVAFRTVDNTVSSGESGPFGGAKLGIYSYWQTLYNGQPAETTLPNIGATQQFEFYNYQVDAISNSGNPDLLPNLGEIKNDYFSANHKSANGIAYQYVQAYYPNYPDPNTTTTPYQTNELAIIYPQIATAYMKAFNLWAAYVVGQACGAAAFSITLPNPPTATINGPNGSATVTVGANFNGFSSIALSINSFYLPPGVTPTFTPGSITSGTSTLKLQASGATPGTYVIPIAGAGAISGGATLTQIATLTLTITPS